jgi:transcriptional regulator with XRE-family HTH domain
MSRTFRSSEAGARLRSTRLAAGLTGQDLSRRASLVLSRDKPLHASALRNQENGTNGIPARLAEAYADILGVSPGWLLFGEGGRPPHAPEARPLRLCGLCRAWHDRPCGNGCVWQPTDPTLDQVESGNAGGSQ